MFRSQRVFACSRLVVNEAIELNSSEGGMVGLTIDQITVGDSATIVKIISEADINVFADVTGDKNPAHIDQEYASQTFFGGKIAHGMLLASYISAVIGTRLPGPGAIYLNQSLKFLAPARIGDTITAKVEVVSVKLERNRLVLRTSCTNQSNTLVIDGEALISPPKS